MTFKNDGTPSHLDVTDVVDMKETLREPRVRAEADTIDMTGDTPTGSNSGKGVFLNAKPRQAPAPEQKASLRDRFLPKRQSAAEQAPTAKPAEATAARAEPTAPPKADNPARTWFGKKGAADAPAQAASVHVAPAPAASAPPEPAPRAEGPVGPTKKVKTPIVVSRIADKKKPVERPIRVLIGFLAEVSEREAREYAQGVADRNCQQISLVYFDAFKFGNGCAYEIHEGGSGRAYLPEIIKSFDASGAYRKDGREEASVFIPTATRMVQVSRTSEGLQAFMLPENTTEGGTSWLQGTSKMSPAMPTLVGVLVAGAAVFITGFLSLSLAMVSRIQPYEAPATPKIENVTEGFVNSPLSRWAALQSVSGDEYVKAVRFANGKWEIQRGTAEAPPALPNPAPVDAASDAHGAPQPAANPVN